MYYWHISSAKEIHQRLRMAGWRQFRTSTILNRSANLYTRCSIPGSL